jgi:hypothetical protein
MHPVLKNLGGAVTIFALCFSPTMASAATAAVQPVSPLTAVSVFGTQASAQAVCAGGASAATAAGSAAAAQAPGCVLPAGDPPPPVVPGQAYAPVAPAGNFGVNWLLLGLGALALIAGLSTLFDDDDDDSQVPISPS